jgi:hypothetical protein
MNTTRQWLQLFGVGVLVGGSVAGAAQQLPDATTAREVVSATGCVQRADPADAAAGGQSLDGGFVLKGVRVGPGAGLAERPAVPATTPGTPASNEGSEAANTAEPGSGAPREEARASGRDIAASRARDGSILLVADRGIDLAAHVGHRVMVTGRLSSFAAPGGVASTATGRTLTVTKLDTIAAACTVGS